MFGQVIQVVTCDRCSGRGQTPEKPCTLCNGDGLEDKRIRLNVKVPPGIDDGNQLILRRQGEDGKFGGPPGDLYVNVRVKHHPFLIRRGKDLIYEAAINFAQAALGTEIKVPSLTGEKVLKVPAGTQSGEILRMKGEGIPSRYGRGDQLVHISVQIPRKITRRQREIIEQLGTEMKTETRRAWWWRK